jgi:hypothetical protein
MWGPQAMVAHSTASAASCRAPKKSLRIGQSREREPAETRHPAVEARAFARSGDPAEPDAARSAALSHDAERWL